jgi:transposase-like protein
MKSTNMLERVNQEIRRRTQVIRIFPTAESCLHLVRALTAELHDTWIEALRYLNMDLWKEHKQEGTVTRSGSVVSYSSTVPETENRRQIFCRT